MCPVRAPGAILRSVFAAGLLLGLAAACGPKVVTETIYESEGKEVDVSLRHTLDGGEPVPRGYDHPATISDVRLAHILALVAHEDREGKRHSTIRSAHVYGLAEGLNRALERASPDDEVVATAFATDRRFGIFTQERVTSFRAYLQGDLLVLEFFAIEERIEKDPRDYAKREYELPPELPRSALDAKLVAGEARQPHGSRGLAFEWRDPYFRRPVSLSLRGGQLRRRTILMEEAPEAEEAAPDPAPTQIPPELRDAQLRALDQLDAARRAGLITEAEYERRRRLVLEGRLEEAGYPPAAP